VGGALICACWLSSPAQAQVVTGQVAEELRHARLADAVVVLKDESGERAGQSVTDAAGRYLIRAAGAGVFTLQVSRLGYAELESDRGSPPCRRQ
jgi:hypothetical protein